MTLPPFDTDKVLIVDDDEELTFVLAAHLRHAGYEVLLANNGAVGIEVATANLPDVIVMDVKMPVMDGIEATRRLKQSETTKHIPIIMLSARSRTADLIVGLDSGAQEYLGKPFDVHELLARVRTMLRLTKARRDLDAANDALATQVKNKTAQLELLYEFARALNEARNCETIHWLTVQTLQKLTGSNRISLMLKDPNGDHLVCQAAIGMDPDLIGKLSVRVEDGVVGRVYSSGKTMVAETSSGHVKSKDLRYASETFLSTPLITTSLSTQGEKLGVLNVTDREDGKPFSRDEIDCIRSIADSSAIAIRNLQRREQLHDSVKVLLWTVGRLAEYRDEETADHLERVAAYAQLITRELRNDPTMADQISDEFTEHIYLAAPLHDIGKVGIPDEILTKPGALTHEEFQIMKTHTDIGRRTLEFALAKTGPVPMLSMCIDIAYCHHERFDGTGYPRRIASEEIPLAARIIALVDAYDAITSQRRYAPARTHEKAVEIIRSESGRHFDPQIVEAFLRCHEQFEEVRSESAANENPIEPAFAV